MDKYEEVTPPPTMSMLGENRARHASLVYIESGVEFIGPLGLSDPCNVEIAALGRDYVGKPSPLSMRYRQE
jgi:hypothetical protein